MKKECASRSDYAIILALAKRILDKNKSCALSGSVALFYHGIKLPRGFGDIDIYVPYGKDFDNSMLEYYDVPELDDILYDGSSSEGNRMSGNYKLEYYSISGVTVNVFKETVFMNKIPVSSTRDLNEYSLFSDCRVLSIETILCFKASHCNFTTESGLKHMADIRFIFENYINIQ